MLPTYLEIGTIVSSLFMLLYTITILGLVAVIILENRNPLKTIPWVIVLLLAPGIGLIFYFFFGQDNRKQRIISHR
ncbi:MAG: PLDc N-terminal domain-containing protein, partial [Parabacteroides sp.]|nr:PLDc N-terminal domain-containing protein [Parabacteroides sp.]